MNQDGQDAERQFKIALAARVDQEITSRLLPHLAGKADHGYPFHSGEEFHRQVVSSNVTTGYHWFLLRERLLKLQEPNREVFKYIIQRDLDRILRAYLQMVEASIAKDVNQEQTPRREAA